MPLARCEACSDEPNSLAAVDFIALVESLTVVSTLSTRWRNEAMAESIESRCACSVTSSWVATQPPPGIGARTTLIRRPSASLSIRLDKVSNDWFFSASICSCFDFARIPLAMRCWMMAS